MPRRRNSDSSESSYGQVISPSRRALGQDNQDLVNGETSHFLGDETWRSSPEPIRRRRRTDDTPIVSKLEYPSGDNPTPDAVTAGLGTSSPASGRSGARRDTSSTLPAAQAGTQGLSQRLQDVRVSSPSRSRTGSLPMRNPISDLTTSFAVPTIPQISTSRLGSFPKPYSDPGQPSIRSGPPPVSVVRAGSKSRLGSHLDPIPYSDSPPSSTSAKSTKSGKGKARAAVDISQERKSDKSTSKSNQSKSKISNRSSSSSSSSSHATHKRSSTASKDESVKQIPFQASRGHFRSQSASYTPLEPLRTIESVRDQVARGIAIRAVQRAESVDGTKIGLVITLPSVVPAALDDNTTVHFLQDIASKISSAFLTTPYLFILATPIHSKSTPEVRRQSSRTTESSMSSSAAAAHRPFNQSPVLIISSSPEFLERASRLLSAKFIGRVSPSDTTFRMSMMPIYTPITASDSLYYDPAPSHLAYIHSLNHTPYDHPAMYDVLRKSATDLVDPLLPPPGSLGIRQLLTVARSKLQRIHPSDAYNALTEADTPWPVLLVDIRPESVRKRDGVVPGAMHVERNVLEWRFDPRGKVTGSVVDGKVITEDDPEGGRLAIADRYDLRVIVFCTDGYTSSLAAVSLHDIGLLNSTDIIGGFRAWRAAGMPVERI